MIITRMRARARLRREGANRCRCGGKLRITTYWGVSAVAVDCRSCGLPQIPAGW